MVIATKLSKGTLQDLKYQELNSWSSEKKYIMDYFGTKDTFSELYNELHNTTEFSKN